jgi:hypothetical protein
MERTLERALALVGHTLPYNLQLQCETNWCWAAVAASVINYYDPQTAWTQCTIANGQLERQDCCGDGADGPCNVYGYLASSLYRVGCLALWAVGKAATLEQVCSEIDGERPVGVRIEWLGGGAHFVAITGYLEPGGDIGSLVTVQDPKVGTRIVAFANLLSDYSDHPKQTGVWTDTYYTSNGKSAP